MENAALQPNPSRERRPLLLLAGVANVMGLRKIRAWEKTEWCELYDQTAPADALAWNDVHHVVIIPNYKEPMHILQRTLDHLSKQRDARRNMTIVLAMEAAEQAAANAMQGGLFDMLPEAAGAAPETLTTSTASMSRTENCFPAGTSGKSNLTFVSILIPPIECFFSVLRPIS